MYSVLLSCSHSRVFTPPRPVEGPEELNKFCEGRRGSAGFGRGEGGGDGTVSIHFGTSQWELILADWTH
eukprot:scaffold12559_cov125-Isochrysis_galbana.AAC.4